MVTWNKFLFTWLFLSRVKQICKCKKCSVKYSNISYLRTQFHHITENTAAKIQRLNMNLKLVQCSSITLLNKFIKYQLNTYEYLLLEIIIINSWQNDLIITILSILRYNNKYIYIYELINHRTTGYSEFIIERKYINNQHIHFFFHGILSIQIRFLQ